MTVAVDAPAGAALRAWPWLLAAITALGAVLRLRTLGADDLWLDEVLTLYYTQTGLADLWLRPNDPTPPLYYTLHKLVAGGAGSEAAIRAVSAAAGIAAIPVMFALGRSLAGPIAGLAAALFLALSGPHIEYSQEARAYALAFLAVLGSAAALAGALRRGESGSVVFAVLAVLAVYTHLTAVFWLLAAEAGLLIAALRAPDRAAALGRWWRRAFLALAAALPAFGMTASGSAEFDWLASTGPVEALATLGSVGLVRAELGWHGWGDLLLLASLLPGLAWAGGLWPGAGPGRRPVLLVLGALAAFPVLLWTAGLVKPVFMFRTALPFLAVPILLWAIGAALLPRLAAAGLTALVAAVLLASHLGYERSGAGAPDWSGAAAFLDRAASEGDVAILCTWRNFPPLRHYLAEDSPLRVLGVVTPGLALSFPAPAEDPDPWLAHYDPNATAPVAPAPLPAGTTAWMVDPGCQPPLRASLAAYLEAMGARAEVRWQSGQATISAARF